MKRQSRLQMLGDEYSGFKSVNYIVDKRRLFIIKF